MTRSSYEPKHQAENNCQPSPQPNPPADNDCRPDPQPVCDPVEQPSSDHHAALVSADISADIGANLLSDCSFVSLDADIGIDIGLGNDSWHA